MIPVGFLVIAPAIGQHAVNAATLHIDAEITHLGGITGNVEQYPWGFVQNNITAHNPIPLSATLEECVISMYIPASDQLMTFDDPPSLITGTIATFTQPSRTLNHGDNDLAPYNTSMDVNQTQYYGNSPQTFVTFAFGMLFGSGAIEIDIVAEPKLKALGFVTMQVTLAKALNCSAVTTASVEELEELRSKVATLIKEEHPDEFPDDLSAVDFADPILARRLSGVAEKVRVRDWFPAVGMVCSEIGNLQDQPGGKDIIDQVKKVYKELRENNEPGVKPINV
jgi:hypothetical protein